jgi:hypothetical protein
MNPSRPLICALQPLYGTTYDLHSSEYFVLSSFLSGLHYYLMPIYERKGLALRSLSTILRDSELVGLTVLSP